MFGPGLLAVVTASASLVLGQARWLENQVDTRICQWQQLRATVLRDTVYLDGGNLYWQPTYADGATGEGVTDNNPLGLIYTLNFSTPFNTTQNISAILGTLETGGGDINARAPNYEDGALLGNHEEFFLYGGLLPKSNKAVNPPGDSVLCYEKYSYGVSANFESNFRPKPLGTDTTRYIAYGGAASAPSENLAWYFSGLRSPSGRDIYTAPGTNKTFAAIDVSNRLITLDMKRQRFETFTNHTLDPGIPGRANPELVWVPVGKRGILVALGGVVYPDFIEATKKSSNETASRSESPGFMSTIDIYDVDSGKWYRQTTSGGPDQTTRGCAVVARAQDGSSFNIYYYGGYDGLHLAEPYSDDVWVLSLPSFTWIKLASGAADGRAGHKCVMPYPDQMLVIGGYPSVPLGCLRETIRVFSLSSGEWLDRYDPAVYSNYTVPSAVHEKIGGSGTGGATATTPSPSWGATELAGIFAAQYPMSKITTYYPYASVGPTNNTNPNVPPPPAQDQGGGLPSYLPPVLGAVLGLVFLTMVAVLVLLWRRRRLLRGGTASEAGTEDTNGHRITSWLRGQPSEVKAPTVTTTSPSDYSPPMSTANVDSTSTPQRSIIAEIMGREVQMPAELPDNPPPAELHDNPLSTSSATTRASLNNPNLSPTTHQTDHVATTTSARPSPYPSPPPIPQNDNDDESPIFYRPDSDALGRGTTTSATTSPTTVPATTSSSPIRPRDNKVLSGISNLSERDRVHLRQISDTTVSSVTTAPGGGMGGGGNGNGNEREQRVLSGVSALSAAGGGGVGSIVESPAVVSPPTATAGPGEYGGGDYLSARPLLGQQQQQQQQQQQAGQQSPLRRSVFSEDINGIGPQGGGPGGQV
ncbi:hypothetical protein C8A00DRAFT_10974 [Chaetomidium leptoderma]|uniref:Uncharacterized protein n=1 Tax=Chaetomidium leptoderma TaxID=669021 RepID=A0AAN6VWY1_9PEZI|nr:hypothetical protein C8A00DRAFT_10974 [Chaetomidium leptoderma]